MTFEITIPVLNEEETIQQNVLFLHQFLTEHFPDKSQWTILIADNGSTDNTEKLSLELTQKYPEIKLIKLSEKGVGRAVKKSWTASKADIVGYMDLDLATDLPHFLEAYKAIAIDGFDIVYGTRLHPQSQVLKRTLKREISSRAFNLILKMYLRTKFSDGMCGFKFLKQKHISDLIAKGADNDGWFFSTELLTVAEWAKLKIYELPVKWTDDPGNSKVKVIPLAKKYLTSMVALNKRRF